MTGVFIKRGNLDRGTHTGRLSRKTGVLLPQARGHLKLATRHGPAAPPPLRGARPCQHLDHGHLASRTVRQWIPVVWALHLWYFVMVALANEYTVFVSNTTVTFTILGISSTYYKTEDGQKILSYQCLSQSPPTDLLLWNCVLAWHHESILTDNHPVSFRKPAAGDACVIQSFDGCSKIYNIVCCGTQCM